MSERLRWLVVGGGIHGTHLAIRLLAAGVDRSQLRILDPHPRLLERWRVCADNTGMPSSLPRRHHPTWRRSPPSSHRPSTLAPSSTAGPS